MDNLNFPLIAFVFFIAILLITSIRIANQYQRAVILRLGRFVGVRGPGLYILLPFGIERAIQTDIRVTTWTLPQQEAITSDNVPAQITAVLWAKIVNPELAALAVDDVERAIRQFAATTMRTIIGNHPLDEVLSAGGAISATLAQKIEEIAPQWGVEIQRVEIMDVQIPENMQRAIAQKAEANREREARIIKADAEFQAAQKLTDAAKLIAEFPEALELRRLQMLTEIGAEQNTMTVIMIPSEFVSAARAIGQMNQKP